MAYKRITEKQYDEALEAGRQRLSHALCAEAVRYDRDADAIQIALTDTTTISVKRTAIPEWASLSPDAMGEVRLSAVGDAIAVEGYDVQVGITGLLKGILPEIFFRVAFAQRGGAATSPAKAKAARANGTLGGRPKKVAVAV